jgi:hypothetical protein
MFAWKSGPSLIFAPACGLSFLDIGVQASDFARSHTELKENSVSVNDDPGRPVQGRSQYRNRLRTIIIKIHVAQQVPHGKAQFSNPAPL